MIDSLMIENFKIGDNSPCFVIAEAGVNHNGDLDRAIELIKKAKECGADCVKFQTFKAEEIVTKEAPKAKYQQEQTPKSESQLEMLKSLELTEDQFMILVKECQKEGIVFMSTPYSLSDVDTLEQLCVSSYKVASALVVETPLLEHIAKKGKPIILSSGMATMEELKVAVETCRRVGNNQIVLLQCTSNYPSAVDDANILAMTTMKSEFNVIVGYSDHTESHFSAWAAVALGAKVIEKHFTLDKNLPGPDHSSSLDVPELKEFISGIRTIEKSLGSTVKQPTEAELRNREGMRRSLVTTKDLSKGHILAPGDLTFKRPATGIAPKYLQDVIGKKLLSALAADSVLNTDHIE